MGLSYLTPAEVVNYYDSRRVLELASDTGTSALIADLSNTASTPYAIVMTAIRVAASDLDSHCQQGRRYARADLENIITESLAAPTDEPKAKRAGLIRQLIADLTFGFLMSRRGYAEDRMKLLAPRYDMAIDTLRALATGMQVFDLDDTLGAGLPSGVPIGFNGYRPSLYNKMFGIWEDTPRTFGSPRYDRY